MISSPPDTDSLVDHVKGSLGLESNVRFIDKLQTVFRGNTKEFTARDVSGHKWSEFSLILMDVWNLKGQSSAADADDDLPAASQDYILNQYI